MDLILKSGAAVSLFFWVTKPNRSVCLKTENRSLPNLTISNAETQTVREVKFNEQIEFEKPGTYCFTFLHNDGAQDFRFQLIYDEDIYPFLIPGPGNMPRGRIDRQSLWFSGSETLEFFIYAPQECPKVVFGTYYKIPLEANLFELSSENPDHTCSDWLPAEEKHSSWRVCEGSGAGWWSVRKSSGNCDFRINEWNGLAVFLKRPKEEFVFSYLEPENTQAIDYRVSILRNGHIESAWDILYHEKPRIPFVEGDVTFLFSAGPCYKDVSVTPAISKKGHYRKKVEFAEAMRVPKGWLHGDHHVHSVYEDACMLPARITKSGRCNGLDYMFLTDHGGKKILDNGLMTHNEEGRFLPLPGQECVNVRTHMNFLNVDFDIDYQNKTESEWIKEAKDKCSGPYAVMLNHPSHLPEVANTPWGDYFRSWWVATAHKEIQLVENFDFRTWFDHLNRGRKLVGLWTTDTHDGTWQKPGDACSFVFTNGVLSSEKIIAALLSGRVTNCYYPGAFLNLTVNGKMIGDTVKDAGEPLVASVTCSSNVQMKKIDLVVCGKVVKSWDPGDSLEFEGEFLIEPADHSGGLVHRWVLAVMYMKELDCRNDIEGQFESSGVRAFTNPVYIEA